MKNIFQFIMITFMVAMMASCSEENATPTTDGISDYINAVNRLYSNGKPKYTETTTPGIYVAVADDAAMARLFIEQVIGTSWDGTYKVVRFDEKSSITLMAESDQLTAEGIYDELVINFTDYPAYTLQIISEERANDDNGIIGTGVARVDIVNESH